jgi:hypothetical protein
LQPGKFRLSAFLTATRVQASHYVDPDQYEPDVPIDGQSDRHAQTFVLVNANFALSYVLTERLQIQVRIPVKMADVSARFLDKNGETLPEFTSIHHRTETLVGLGDIHLSGRYRLLMAEPERPYRMDLVVGVNVPTGNIEPNPFELGRQGLGHQHIFFGTGTFDPRIGIDLERGFDGWSLGLDTTWSASLYPNKYDYRGPSILLTSVSATSAFGLKDWHFQMGGELFKEYPAQWSDEPAKNSGRLDLSPVLGTTWRSEAGVSLSIIVKRPFILSTTGSQLEVPFILNLGGSYGF